MKKTLAIVAVLAAAVSLASAKSYSMTIGARGMFGMGLGTTFADSNTNQELGKSMNAGGGLFLNFPLAYGIGIQPEVDFTYNIVGTKSVTTAGSLTTTTVGTTSYSTIDIPVNFTYKFNKFTFLAGPVFTIPVGQLSGEGTVTTVIGDNTTTSNYKNDPVDIGSPFIVGMDVGAEYSMRIGLFQGFAGVRYNLDFMPMKNKVTQSDNTVKTTELFTRRYLSAEIGLRMAL